MAAPGPGGREVGRVSVRVLPDTSRFGEQLRGYLTRLEQQLRLSIDVHLEMGELRRDASEARAIIGAIGDETVHVRVDVDTDTPARRVSSMVKDINEKRPGVFINIRDNLSGFARRIAEIPLGRIKGISESFAQMRILIGQAVAYTALLGPAILLAAAGVGAMLPAFATLLPLVAVVASVFGTFKMGGEELKRAFAPIPAMFTGIKSQVSALLSAGILPLTQAVADKLGPVFRSTFTGLASAINATMKEFLSFAASSQAVAGTKVVMDGVVESTKILGSAVKPLSRAFLQIAEAATPGWEILATAIANTAIRFSEFIEKASQSGRLKEVITNSILDLLGFFRGVWAVGKSLYGLLKELWPIAQDVFGFLGDTLIKIADGLTAAIKNIEEFAGSASLADSSVKPLLDSALRLYDTVKDLATQFKDWLGPILKDFGERVGPGAKSFFKDLLDSINELIPSVERLAKKFGPVIEDFAKKLGDKLGPALEDIGKTLKEDVTPALKEFLDTIEPGVQGVAIAAQMLGGTVLGVFDGIVKVVQGAMKVISGQLRMFSGLLSGDWSKMWSGFQKTAEGTWMIIGGVVTAGWSLIRGQFERGWGLMVGQARLQGAAVVGAFSAMGSGVTSAARALWDGVRGAFEAGVDAVVSAVRGMASAIQEAVSGLAGVMVQMGRDLIHGLANGIRDAAADARGAAVDAVRGALGAAAGYLRINSPSKRARDELGKPIGEGIAVGLKESARDINDTMKRVMEKVAKTGSRLASKIAKAAREQLLRVAVRRDDIMDQLEDAREALKELKEEAKRVAEDAAATVVATGDITKAKATGKFGDLTFSDIKSQLELAVRQAKRFANEMWNLAAQGLNKTMLAQLAAAGPEGGLRAAYAISTGGFTAVKQLNELQEQLDKAGKSVGSTVSRALYESGIEAAQGLIDGLKSKRDQLTETLEKIASDLVAALRKALKISSPSKVMRDQVGKWMVLGVADGITGHARHVATAMKSAVAVDPGAMPVSAAPGAGAGGALVNVERLYAWDEEKAAEKLDRRFRLAAMQFGLG